MPRFVLLEHDHPILHWDLMLESGDSLRTWRLARAPERGGDIEAIALPDHRLAYLEYEGPVSGGRGSVSRWDRGTYSTIVAEVKRLELQLCGERVRGRVELQQLDSEK